MAPSVKSLENATQATTEQLQKLDLNAKLKPRCMGRCDIALGEVTHHNVQVCFIALNVRFVFLLLRIGGDDLLPRPTKIDDRLSVKVSTVFARNYWDFWLFEWLFFLRLCVV